MKRVLRAGFISSQYLHHIRNITIIIILFRINSSFSFSLSPYLQQFTPSNHYTIKKMTCNSTSPYVPAVHHTGSRTITRTPSYRRHHTRTRPPLNTTDTITPCHYHNNPICHQNYQNTYQYLDHCPWIRTFAELKTLSGIFTISSP